MPPRPPSPLRRWAAGAREIVAPSSLPDPVAGSGAGPGRHRRRRSLADRWRLVAAGTRDYLASWRAAGDEDAEPEEAGATPAGPPDPPPGATTAAGLSTAEAAARAAVRGAEALRPGVQHLFRSRAAAYRDAVFSFADGFREGVAGGGGGGGGEGGDAGGDGRRRPPPRTASPPPPPCPD